jgi:hypothetical protein
LWKYSKDLAHAGAVANPMGTIPFRSLVTQASAVLLTHGVEVEGVAVRGVAEHLVETAARRSGVDLEDAVHPVAPETVAEVIAIAMSTAEEKQGTPRAHAVRPARIDDSTASVPVEALGHLVMAASPAAPALVAVSGRRRGPVEPREGAVILPVQGQCWARRRMPCVRRRLEPARAWIRWAMPGRAARVRSSCRRER